MNVASWPEAAALQLLHALLVVAVAPALTGIVRLVKSRLTGKRGAPIWQPYRDLWRLLRKEAVVAETASWLFRVAPYLTCWWRSWAAPASSRRWPDSMSAPASAASAPAAS
jgi:formate hydrogenlyase subunit 4